MRTGAAMLGFPPVLPEVSWRFSTRLPRDHYVRVYTNDYSVNPRFVGRRVEVTVTLDEVVATCEGTEVARHRRCLGQTPDLLAPEHARVLRAMRAEARGRRRRSAARSRSGTCRCMTGRRGGLMAAPPPRPKPPPPIWPICAGH